MARPAPPGPQFVEFGSHTPCVEVRCGERLFIIDAGTGLAALGSHLGNNAPDTVDILFSHLHLDHISGLPFFKPALLSNERIIRTFCGNLDGESAEDALARLYSPPLVSRSASTICRPSSSITASGPAIP